MTFLECSLDLGKEKEQWMDLKLYLFHVDLIGSHPACLWADH